MVLQNYWESGREHKELFFISQHMFYFFVGAIFIVFVRFIFSLKIHRSPLCIFDDFVSTRKLLQVHTSVKISNLIMLWGIQTKFINIKQTQPHKSNLIHEEVVPVKNSFTLYCSTTLSGCVITSLPSETVLGIVLNTSTTTLIKGFKIPLYQHTDSDQYPENIV
jgi:hypothetical protein